MEQSRGTFVVRHGGYESVDGVYHLTDWWKKKSIYVGRDIQMLIGDTSDQVRIISSSAPRAYETAVGIQTGIGSQTDIITLDELWDDDEHAGNIEAVLAVLREIPPHLALIIITHVHLSKDLALALGYTGNTHDLAFGEYFHIPKTIHACDDPLDLPDSGKERCKESAETGEWEEKIDMEIPVGKGRVIKIIEAIAVLQSEEGNLIQFGEGEKTSFIVPKIVPSGDPELSMQGEYDAKGGFPVTITLLGTRACHAFLSSMQLESETKSAYTDEITGLQRFFCLYDSTIDPHNWKRIKS